MGSESKQPPRIVQFSSLADLEKELDVLLEASQRSALTVHGNWSLGQNAQHIGKFVNGALSGFDGQAPWVVRKAAKMMFKKKALGPEPMPAGFKLPKSASSMLPDPGINDEDGVAYLKEQIARVQHGEKFSHPSPLFEALTHEEWMTMQLKHAALHLGFLEPK